MPLRPSGLRTMHVAGAGLALGLALPLAMLFALIKFDPRTRSAKQIERETGLQVIGTMPPYRTRQKRLQGARKLMLATALFSMVPVVYGMAYMLKMLEVL